MTLIRRFLSPLRRSLRTRLVGYFLALSTVTVLVVGAITYARATGDLTSSVYDRLDAIAGLKAEALDRWIDEQIRSVVFVGVMPGVGGNVRTYLDEGSTAAERDAAETALRQLLAAVVSQTADAEEILILDLVGTIRMSTLADHEGLSQAAEAWFTTGSSHTNVQNAYRSTLTNRPTITVASPLFDKDGKGQRVAVIAANLSLERVDRIVVLDRAGLGTTGRAYLVGGDGVPIQGTTGDGGLLQSAAVEAITDGRSGRGLYVDPNGTPVIGVYTWLADRNAGIIAELSQDEAFAPARQLALTIAVVGLGSALLLAAGIWVIARRVTRPILALAATASRVRAGDLEATSGVRSEDEVGVLATAFDEMTAELRENVATLEQRVIERTAEINRQKQYFEALVEVSPVAVVTMDRDEIVSGWNPAAVRLFGYETDEAVGRHIDDLLFAPEERGEGRATTRLADETGRAQLIGRRQRKDGEAVDVEIALVPLVVDGEHTGYYAIYHDITELEAARRGADAANQAKSSFLAAMSHEIRTPMNAVLGMSGLLLATKLDEEQRDFAESISVSGEALLTIINDILDFSKIEAGRFELEFRPFDLRRTVDDAVGLIRPNAAKKGLELDLTVEGDPAPLLLGDAGRIRQILLNLLSNAVKFTDQGRVTLGVSTTPLDGRRRVRVTVRDTGIGITADGLGRLFQSFSQADASIARRYGGTGLGLAISRRLAELMGGTLVADSAGIPGEGSTFELAFDAEVAPAEALAAIDERARVSAASSGGALAGTGDLRVLLAEDNPMNQKLALRLLKNMGLAADVAANGLEAVAAIERQPYDVILMDVQMPDMDGLEATRWIRAAAPATRPWIIAMTANAMEGDREACLAAGMDDYLSKPIRPDLLAAALALAPAAGERPKEASPRTDVPRAVDPGGLERLLEMTGRDRAFLDEVVETYLEDAAAQLEAMRAAAELGSADLMIRPAHSLKGNSLNVGAEQLAEQCRQLETDGRSGTVDRARERVAAAAVEFGRVKDELMRLRAAG